MSFSHFLIFISEQWVLVFALLLSLNLLLFTESRKAGPALSPQQAINLTNREGGIFLDVRDAKDYKRAHISEAVNIPAANLLGRLGELENYKDKPVIAVCRMGTNASNKSVSFTEISVDGDAPLRAKMAAMAGATSVPQIWIGDQHVGGCDELYGLERQQRLDSMLQEEA